MQPGPGSTRRDAISRSGDTPLTLITHLNPISGISLPGILFFFCYPLTLLLRIPCVSLTSSQPYLLISGLPLRDPLLFRKSVGLRRFSLQNRIHCPSTILLYTFFLCIFYGHSTCGSQNIWFICQILSVIFMHYCSTQTMHIKEQCTLPDPYPLCFSHTQTCK